MEEYIAFDSHKHCTWVEQQEANTGKLRQYRRLIEIRQPKWVGPTEV